MIENISFKMYIDKEYNSYIFLESTEKLIIIK